MKRNARVTIPFEIDKLGDIGTGLNGGVLEGAIYAVRSGANPALKDVVDRQIAALIAEPGAGQENRHFELGAALFAATGDRRLIDASYPPPTRSFARSPRPTRPSPAASAMR